MNLVLCSLFFLILQSCSSNSIKSSSASGSSSFSEPNDIIQMQYTYKNLKILDLDLMSDYLTTKIEDFKKNQRLDALREAVLIAYSRPNEDDIISKIISPVKNLLEDNEEWESTLNQVVTQSIQMITDESDQFTPSQQVTAGIILENIISESKPAFMQQTDDEGLESVLIQRIAANEVKLSKKAQQEKQLNLMVSNLSPSDLAKKIIQLRADKVKAEQKAKEQLNKPKKK